MDDGDITTHALKQLESSLHGVLKASANHQAFCTPTCLYRYLKNKKGDADRASKAILQTLEWREKRRPHEIKCSDIERQLLHSKLQIYTLDNDRKGQPIIAIKVQSVSESHRLINFSVEERIALVIYTIERAIRRMQPGVYRVVFVVQCAGFGKRDADTSLVRELAEIFKNHYPELFDFVCLFDAPLGFRTFFKLLTPFIPAAARRRIYFLSSDPAKNREHQAFLEQSFNLDRMEKCYAGRSEYAFNAEDYLALLRAEESCSAASPISTLATTTPPLPAPTSARLPPLIASEEAEEEEGENDVEIAEIVLDSEGASASGYTGTMAGYLMKRGKRRKAWQKRYFVFDGAACQLRYYKAHTKLAGKPKGAIDLGAAADVELPTAAARQTPSLWEFFLLMPKRRYALAAFFEDERRQWVELLSAVIIGLKTVPRNPSVSATLRPAQSTRRLQATAHRTASERPPPSAGLSLVQTRPLPDKTVGVNTPTPQKPAASAQQPEEHTPLIPPEIPIPAELPLAAARPAMPTAPTAMPPQPPVLEKRCCTCVLY